MPYLDVIHRLRTASALPIAAYHVSGEYAMMKAAAQKVYYTIPYSTVSYVLYALCACLDFLLVHESKHVT